MTSPLLRYGYLNAKLRAKMADMRSSTCFDQIRKAGSMLETLEILKDSPYEDLCLIYENTGDLALVEKALVQKQLEQRRFVLSNLDEKPRNAAAYLLQKVEIDNLKNTLRIWMDSKYWDLASSNRMNYLLKEHIYSDIDWDELINATDWESFCKALKDTPYEKVCSGYNIEQLKEDQLAFLEMDLDKVLYDSYQRALRNLPSHDRKVATEILYRDMDLKNILILMRYGSFYKLDGDKIKLLLLQGGNVFDSKACKKYLEDRDALALLKAFLPSLANKLDASSFQGKALLETMVKIEHFLGAERRREYTAVLRKEPFTMALVMAYFFEYDSNDRVLRTLLNAKAYKLDEAAIMGVNS